jgi:hypothetical protein
MSVGSSARQAARVELGVEAAERLGQRDLDPYGLAALPLEPLDDLEPRARTLTERAADQAGADTLKALLEGRR